MPLGGASHTDHSCAIRHLFHGCAAVVTSRFGRAPFLSLTYRGGPDSTLIFFLLAGGGIMVIGDWADSGSRTRSFEVRRLAPGHFAMLKGGNLHGLMNPADVPSSLFMFGGYD